MSWFLSRWRKSSRPHTSVNRSVKPRGLYLRPVMEMLEDRITPAVVLFDSATGILNLDLAGSENMLLANANATGAQLLVQMAAGQTLDTSDKSLSGTGIVASSTTSSAILNLDLGAPSNIVGLKINYGTKLSNIVTFSDFKPAALLDITLNDDATSGVNTLVIAGGVDLSAKNSSFLTTSSTASPTYAQSLRFQLNGKLDAGTGDIRLNSKLIGKGVTNFEVGSPDSPDLKGTNITIDVGGSIGFDKTGNPQPLELQSSGVISIQNSNNAAQLKSISGPNTFSLLELGTGTATLFGDFKTKAAEVVGNKTTIEFDSTAILGLGGDETVRTLIGSGKLNLGNSNGFKLNLDTIEFKSYAGVIDGGSTGLVTIMGIGTQELSGTSTYTGGTDVTAGATLQLINSAGAGKGDITVRDGATLNLKGGIAPANKVIITGKGVGSTTLGALQNLSGTNSLTGTLVVSGNALINVPTGTLTLGAVTLSGLLTTYAAAGTAIRYSGVVDDAANTFGLKTTGTGPVTLAVKNTYDGGTNITEGTTTILNEAALGTATAVVLDGASLIVQGGTFSVANNLSIAGKGFGGIGAIQNLSGTNTIKGDIAVNQPSLISVKAGSALVLVGKVQLGGELTLNAEAGTTITVNGVIDDGSATYGLVTQGSGAVILTNANLYNGGTVVGAGSSITLAEVASTSQGSLASPTVTLTDAASQFIFKRSDAEATPFVFSPIISGPGSVTVSTGAVLYNTTQAYTGPTTLNTSTVLLVGDTTVNGWLDAKSNIIDNGKLIFQRNDTKTIPNYISGTGTVIFRSTGTFTVSTDNDYQGGTTIEPGTTLILASARAAGTGSITVVDTADLRLDGTTTGGITVVNPISVTGQGRDNAGALRTVAGNNSFGGAITLNSSIFIGTAPGTGNDLTISGVMTDGTKFYGITLFGLGKLIVTNSNTYDGNTNLFKGDLVLRNANGAGPTGTILIQPGNTLYLDPMGGGSMTLSNNISLAGPGRGNIGAIVNQSGANTINGDVALNASSTISALPGTTLILLSTLDDGSASYDITLQGGGTVILGAESLYDGTTRIVTDTTGILTAKNAAGTGPMVVDNGATLALKGGISAVNNIQVGGMGVNGGGAIQNLAGDNTLSGTGLLTADTLVQVATGTKLTWTGVIDDGIAAYALSAQGGGNLILTANNTFNGKTNIAALTTLTLGAGGTTGSLNSAEVANSGTLVFNRIDTTAAPFVFTPFISGAGAVLINTGAVQFVGDHTYTGNTTINTTATLIIGNAGTNGSVVGDIIDNGALWYRRTGANPVIIQSTITGTGTVTFKDTATYRLVKANNYSGVTTIDAGATVEVGDGTATSVGAISTGFGSTATGSVVINGSLVFNAGGANRFVNQTLSGAGKVTYQAKGLYVVSGSNTYAGVTTISDAQVMLTTDKGASTNTIAILASGTLGLDLAAGIRLTNAITATGTGQLLAGAIRSKSGNNELAGAITLTGNTTLSNLTSDTGSLRFSNVISGAFGVTVAGPQQGTRFTAANSYTGATTILAGARLVLGDGTGNTGSLASSSVVLNTDTPNGDGKLQFNRLDLVSAPYKFAAAISGKGAVDILTGAVIFTGANTFTGTTTIYLAATLIIGDGSSNGTITSNIVDNGLLIFDVTLASSALPGLVIPGTISGTGDVQFRQSGPYTLTADNAYTGVTTINSGATVQIGNGGATGSLTGLITNNGTLIFNRSANLVISQNITSTSGFGAVVFMGGAQFLVSGSNTWALGTTVTGSSTLVMASATAAGTGTITVDNGASLAFKGTAALTVANPIIVGGNGAGGAGALQNLAFSNTLTGTISLTANTLATLSGGNTLKTSAVISGAFGLSIAGSGKLLTTANNSYSGTTTIGTGTTLQLGDGTGTTGSVASTAISDNGALVFNRTDLVGAPFLVNAVISGSGTLTVLTGAVQLNKDNTYTGDTAISLSTSLLVGDKGGSGAIYQPAVAGKIANNGILIFQRNDGTFTAPLTTNAAISGSGSVVYRSGGIFQASGASSYSGGTRVEVSTGLILAIGTSAGTGDILVASSGTLALQGGITVANKITGGGLGVAGTAGLLQTLSGANILTGAITLTANSAIRNLPGTSLRVNSSITDGANSFSVTTIGGGRLELPGVNTYDGGTVLNEGTVMVGKAGSAGTGAIQIFAGATLELNSSTAFTLDNAISTAGTISALGGNHTLSGNETLTGTTTYNNNGTTLTVTGIISDGASSYGVISQGTGSLQLQAANSFDGDTNALQGTVVLSNNNSAGSGLGTIVVASGATLAVSGSGLTISNPVQLAGTLNNAGGANSLTGPMTLLANVAVVAAVTSTLTLAGVVTDGSSKFGISSTAGGTLVLAKANIFDGELTVDAGTVILQNATAAGSGSITVANGSTLIVQGAGLTIANPLAILGKGAGGNGALINTGGANTLSGQVTFNGSTLLNVTSTLTIRQGIRETVSSGLSLAGTGRLILAGANLYTGGSVVNGATLQIGDGKTGSVIGNISDLGAVEFNLPGVAVILAGLISGTGTLAFMGGGKFTVTGANTVSGVTTIYPTTTLTVGNGAGSGWLPGNFVNNGQLTFDKPAFTTISQNISGTGLVLYRGGASYIVNTKTGANSYSGGTQVLAGNTLILTADTSAGVGGLVQIADGATLQLNSTASSMKLTNPLAIAGGGTDGISGALQNLKGSNTLAGPVALTGAATRFSPGDATLVISGVVSQSGVTGASFNLIGKAGTVLMTADNTYTGTTLISAGTTLQLGAGGAGGSIQSTGIYDNGSLVFNRQGALTTLAALISGDGQVTVLGGDVNFTGENTYAGPTFVQGSGTLTVGDGNDAGSITSPSVDIDGGALFELSRSGSQLVLTEFMGTGQLSLESSGFYTIPGNSFAFNGLLLVGSQASAEINGNLAGTDADVFGTLSGTGTLGQVTTEAGSSLQPGPGAAAHLNIAGLNQSTGSGAVIFDIYGNQQPVTNTYLLATSKTSQFNIGGLQLIVNGESPFTGNGFVQKLVENGPGGSVIGTFVDAAGQPIPDGGTVAINNTTKTAIIDYSFGPDNNDVALLFVENLVYSLYTYQSSTGTLDVQLGEDTNVTVTGDSATGFSLTLTDNLTGRNIGWVQEGGDSDLPTSTTTSAKFTIPNLRALNITQRTDVSRGTNTVGFGDTSLHFSDPAKNPGLRVDLPLATGDVSFTATSTAFIDGITSFQSQQGDITSSGTGTVSLTQPASFILGGIVNLPAAGNSFGGALTLNANSANLGSTGNLSLASTQLVDQLSIQTKGSLTQTAGTAIVAPAVSIQATGAVVLGNTGNDFDTLEVLGSGDLTVQDMDALQVQALIALTGGLSIATVGALGLPGGTVQTSGNQSYFAGSGGISVDGAEQNLFQANGKAISFEGASISTPGSLDVAAKTARLAVASVSALSQNYQADVTTGSLAVTSLGGPVVFGGSLTASSFTQAGASPFRVELLGGGSFANPVNFTAGGTLVLGDATTDIFLFQEGFSAIRQLNAAPTQLAGVFRTTRGAVQVQNLALTAHTTIDTYFGNSIGNTITLTGTQDLGGRTLTLFGTGDSLDGDSTYTPGRVDAAKGALTLGGVSANTTATFDLAGNIAGATYPQLRAANVSLTQVGLAVSLDGGFIPPLASTFKIVDNTGSAPVNGTFIGLAEGSTIVVGDETLRISYVGGDGNDIVLTNIRQLPVPTGPQVAEPFSLAAGSVVTGVGSGNVLIHSATGADQVIQPFPGYFGSINMTTVDRSGDGIADSIAVMVAGSGSPAVVVIDSATGKVAASFYAFSPQFLGGGTLAAGVVNMEGRQESVILIGAGPGAQPSVTVFNSYDFVFEKAFYAYAQQYTGGVTVGMCSPDATGNSLIITGSAINSHVVLFDINDPAHALASWYAFAPSSALQQMTVAGGDLDRDGFSEVIVGAATGWPASIAVFSTKALLAQKFYAEKAFYAFVEGSPAFTSGVRVGVSDVNRDGFLDVLAGSGPGQQGLLNAFDYRTLDQLFAEVFDDTMGVTVASNLTTR